MKFTPIASLIALSCLSSNALSQAYSIEELNSAEVASNNFGLSIDNTGLILTSAEDIFNPPIDLSLLPLDNEQFIASLTDEEGVRNGQFNDTDYELIVAFIRASSASESPVAQQLASFSGFSAQSTDLSYVNGFDTTNDELNSFEFESDTLPVDSTNGTHIIANSEGAFEKFEYINSDNEVVVYNLPSYDQRAFVQVGENVTELVPENVVLGGNTRVAAISDSLQVVGTTSVNTTEAFDSAIENCDDDDVRGDIPIESCYRSLLFSTSVNSLTRNSNRWVTRANVWTLDSQGSVVDSITYGLTFDLDDDLQKNTSYFSTALGINNLGQAVGSSSLLFNETVITTIATLYENGESTRIIEDDDRLPNSAVAINDNELVVGSYQELINGAAREKMFVHDLTNNETRYVTGFFESSGTTPRAINENNIIVGNADIEAGNVNRRKVGFIYDYNNDTFTDVNTLVGCNSEYTISEVVDINSSGELVATALAKRPLRNAKGEVLFDSTGEQQLIDAAVTLRLTPTGQEPLDCSEEEADPADVRQGASLSLWLILGIFSVGFLRFFRRQ